jgi:hypothetical protein
MTPLERLFRLEVEFHRLLRNAPGTPEPVAPHVSYAIANGYDQLLRSLGPVTVDDVERMCQRLLMSGDLKDVFAAGDSLRSLLRLWPESS